MRMEALGSVDPHLEILDPGVLPLQQTLELEVGLGAVKEDDIHIHIVPVLVQEIRQEHGDWLEGDVSTHNNVPGKHYNYTQHKFHS